MYKLYCDGCGNEISDDNKAKDARFRLEFITESGSCEVQLWCTECLRRIRSLMSTIRKENKNG
jgi:hypothetical protein